MNNLIGQGRKRLTSSRIDRTMISNRKNSASNVAMDLKNNYQTSITPQTIRNRMHEIGYRGCIARRKPFVKKSNRYKRVLWAREHLSKPKEFWHSRYQSHRTYLERRLRPYSPKNKDDLWSIIQQEWREIGREVTSKLVNSMPNRL